MQAVLTMNIVRAKEPLHLHVLRGFHEIAQAVDLSLVDEYLTTTATENT